MIEAYIIDDYLRQKREKNRQRDRQGHQVELPLPEYEEVEKPVHEDSEPGRQRGIITL